MTTSTRFVLGGPILDTAARAFVDDHMVVVEGDRFVGVEPASQLPSDAVHVIDVAGAHILPGLIDAHTHLMSRSGVEADAKLITTSAIDGVIMAKRQIESGVTSLRDPGCKHRGIHQLRDEIASGRIVGPRAYTAGPNIVGSGAPVDWRNHFVDGVDDVRKAVREEIKSGADLVKLVLSHTAADSDWDTCLRYLNDEEIATAVAEAHLLGTRVGCHCEGLPAARAAVNAGIDVIDHGLALDDALVAQMAEQGTFYVPTLWAFSTNTHLHIGKTIPEERAALYEEKIAGPHRESVQRAMAAGVKIAAGTDPVHWIPARDVMVCELETLVAAGMAPIDALLAATAGSADAIGDPTIGSIRPGNRADLAVFDGDPLRELRALARPRLVMKDGEILVDLRHDQAAADALWADLATGIPASDRQPELWGQRA
ncbi:amidohydrolase family protein [Agromyces soli]|uniref:Amidohydrolase family protein n=1 Tax=Agromyces soli TaxID=659012 RepID=A0ABY4AST9_9MICO|nr:amidohydrolase family protein [Agromyces soli]UOE26222.1 amidohydrolase family protein [Agromyces soli]